MDIKKAQRLFIKIQAFLDNGNAQEISRLEKDLLRSYIIQLYEAVTDVEEVKSVPEKQIEFVEYKMPKREVPPVVEAPPVKVYEPPKTEIFQPVYQEPVIPPVREKTPEPEVTFTPAYKHVEEEAKPVTYHDHEPVKEEPVYHAPHKVHHSSSESNETLHKLFDAAMQDDLSGRFSHVPIPSIESAMGLNERIFTLNDLFGGNKGLFDATCSKLNSLNSFADAKALLIAGPAKDYNWSSTDHTKMAEQFIRIVARRYPKTGS